MSNTTSSLIPSRRPLLYLPLREVDHNNRRGKYAITSIQRDRVRFSAYNENLRPFTLNTLEMRSLRKTACNCRAKAGIHDARKLQRTLAFDFDCTISTHLIEQLTHVFLPRKCLRTVEIHLAQWWNLSEFGVRRLLRKVSQTPGLRLLHIDISSFDEQGCESSYKGNVSSFAWFLPRQTKNLRCLSYDFSGLKFGRKVLADFSRQLARRVPRLCSLRVILNQHQKSNTFNGLTVPLQHLRHLRLDFPPCFTLCDNRFDNSRRWGQDFARSTTVKQLRTLRLGFGWYSDDKRIHHIAKGLVDLPLLPQLDTLELSTYDDDLLERMANAFFFDDTPERRPKAPNLTHLQFGWQGHALERVTSLFFGVGSRLASVQIHCSEGVLKLTEMGKHIAATPTIRKLKLRLFSNRQTDGEFMRQFAFLQSLPELQRLTLKLSCDATGLLVLCGILRGLSPKLQHVNFDISGAYTHECTPNHVLPLYEELFRRPLHTLKCVTTYSKNSVNEQFLEKLYNLLTLEPCAQTLQKLFLKPCGCESVAIAPDTLRQWIARVKRVFPRNTTIYLMSRLERPYPSLPRIRHLPVTPLLSPTDLRLAQQIAALDEARAQERAARDQEQEVDALDNVGYFDAESRHGRHSEGMLVEDDDDGLGDNDSLL